MKKVFFWLLALTLVFSQKLEITDFQTDVYSKKSKDFSKKMKLEALIIGRDVEENSYKVVDALNVVIGSFFAEDLLTSKGKEGFKTALMKYTSRKYSVEIDEIYIKKFFIVDSPKVDDIVDALRKEGCCGIGVTQEREVRQMPEEKLKGKKEDIIVIE